MLRGCWLLTDLDGTLVPTPHKAHGQYHTVAEGPCFSALQKWLSFGGNVCVITTADRRVFQQVHVPLQHHLRSISPTADSGGLSHAQEAEGQLLLSMCTGAVLYQSTPQGLCLEPSYLSFPHTDLIDSSATTVATATSGEPKTAVTCLDREHCIALHDIMVDIFLHYARDVIFEVPEALESLTALSKRYRLMWSKLLHYLSTKYHLDRAKQHAAFNPNDEPSSAAAGGAGPSSEMLWKFNHLRTHDRMLNKVGIVRWEHISAVPATLRSPAEVTGASEPAKPPPAPRRDEQSFVSFLQKLLGVDASLEETSTPSATTEVPKANQRQKMVAQMILVGIPMKAFEKYFGPYRQVFDALGVSAISQPNSVVFSRRGIDKSATVRYLDRSFIPRVPGGWGTQQGVRALDAPNRDCYPPNAAIGQFSFANSVNLKKSVALGDNPHTADHQLTVFPELRFVSVEKHDQRKRRHEEILAVGGGGTDRGPFMDDRKVGHLHFVGGEEDGTKLFLDELISEVCRLHTAQYEGAPQSHQVGEDTFQLAITNASKRAAQLAAVGDFRATNPPPLPSSL